VHQGQFIDYRGYRYRTLQHHSHAAGASRCDGSTARRLPFSYEICDNDEDSRHVCSSFMWQADCLVFSDGAVVSTASQASAAGAATVRAMIACRTALLSVSGTCWRSWGMLVKERGCFAAAIRFSDVLLRRRLDLFTA
jgi:hypothetical protein